MKGLAHVAGRLFNTPLAVTAARADVLAGLVSGWMRGESRAAATAGMPTDATPPPYTVTSQRVAIVPVLGTLVHRASWMDAESGLVGYTDVVNAVEAAANDPNVGAILLQLDSPGGEVAGAFEAAAAIREVGKRKTIWAVADSAAYSAAYLLASAAERIVVPQTGGLGSIGVIAMRLDATEADAKLGMKWSVIKAGEQKAFGNPHTPMTETEAAVLQGKVDEINDLFVSTIAERRKLTPRAVAGLQAGTFAGEAAKRVGLADQIGTFNDALAGLTAALNDASAARGVARGGTKMSTETTTTAVPVISPTAAAEAPKVVPINPDDPAIKAAIEAATARAVGDVAEVVALCAAFRCPERANAFVAEKKTRDEVFAILQAELVAKDAATATSGAHSGAAPEATQKKLDPAAYEALRNQAVLEAHARRSAPLTV